MKTSEREVGLQITARGIGIASIDHDITEKLQCAPEIPEKGLTPQTREAHSLNPNTQYMNPNPYAAPGLNREDQVITINMDMVVELVCKKMKITRATMVQKTRQREILVPRQVAMAFTREFVPYLTLEYIGKHLGGLKHCDVIHAGKVVRSTWMHDKICGYGPVVTEIHEELLAMKAAIKKQVVLQEN